MDTEEVDHTAVIAPLVVVLLVVFLVRRHYQKPDYNHILTVGFSRFPFYYISAFNFLFNACKILQEGCRRHGHAVFKIPDFVRWNVVITSPPLLEELRNAPEDKISFVDTHVCPGLSTNRAHSTLLSTKLTRTLPVVLGEMREEIFSAFAETIPKVHVSSPPGIQAGQDNIPGEESMVALGDIPNVSDPPSNAPSSEEGRSDDADWTSVLGGDAMTEVAKVPNFSYLTNNTFGLRGCGQAYMQFFHLLCSDIFGGVSWKARRLRKSLEDIIRQRREKPHKPEELPHNLLTSLLSSPSSNPRDIADALLTLNLQAVPSCALTLTNALHRFATCPPGVLKAMRFDVEGAVREEGWTMRALERMVTIDSFLKETMRVDKLHAPAFSQQ
ncbi:hypothetical protein H0H87_004496 [Tephrocybe sp. NHM501043]|nr:hypothetical protein H0H87_004496 [Tephrocybe sp. NHM501043]